jgi:glycosyltransferase involved in cell wall biosynthesis
VANTNGCDESIIEGENGSIILVKNTDALYGAMLKMIKDNAFRTSLQQKAREMTVSCLGQIVV